MTDNQWRVAKRGSLLRRGVALWFLVLAVVAGCAQSPPPAQPTPALRVTPTPVPGQWTVDPALDLGPISPLIYGVSHGPWVALTDKMLPLALEAGITLFRFPGGEWGDENDLTPAHIDQFAAMAQQFGAQVNLNTRLYKGTPEKAAELVRYANIEKGYGFRYWAIGNETTLYASARAMPDYGVAQFNAEWREYALAMKAVDPTILLFGPELHQFGSDLASTPKDPFGLDWMTEFLKANGDLVDIVSIHRYPFPAGNDAPTATPAELRASSAEWDTLIPYLRALIRETTGRDLPIAVTEVNSHWTHAIGGETTPDSFASALWWADVLGRMINQEVAIVNYFMLSSPSSLGGYGIFARSEPRPTYYVYRLYKQFGNHRLYAASSDALVGVYAARRADGALTLMLVNQDDEAITRPLVVQGQPAATAELWRLDATTSAELIGEETFTSGAPFTLPAQSVTLVVLPHAED